MSIPRTRHISAGAATSDDDCDDDGGGRSHGLFTALNLMNIAFSMHLFVLTGQLQQGIAGWMKGCHRRATE